MPAASPSPGNESLTYPCDSVDEADRITGSFSCQAGDTNTPAGVSFQAYMSDATGDPENLSQVNLKASFGLANPNPGTFVVPKPVIAYAQATLTDMPSIVAAGPSGLVDIQYAYGGAGQVAPGIPADGAPFTCTLFEDSTMLSQGIGAVAQSSIDCYAYSANPGATTVGANYVYLTMPPEFDVGHQYTMIVSQGTPAPSPSPMAVRRHSYYPIGDRRAE
jgi:hypothetical protein